MREADRRNHPRKPVEIDVVLRLADGQIVSKGRVHNISLAGAFIQMAEPLPTRTEVEIEFLLPVSPHEIRCTGVVVWSSDECGGSEQDKTGIGVQLRHLGPTELKFIAGLLEQSELD